MNRFRCAVLSVVKHAYVPRSVASHPRFELAVVADDPNRPDWTHERNQKFADEYKIPYIRDVEKAGAEHGVQVAVVSSEAERHCDLSVRAANAGLHVVQDKPMSNRLSECDRLVEAVERNGVKFLMWNRNFLPAVLHAREIIASGAIGKPYAIHVDFYFSKDAGPPKGTRRPSNSNDSRRRSRSRPRRPWNWLSLAGSGKRATRTSENAARPASGNSRHIQKRAVRATPREETTRAEPAAIVCK
jgi:predicted dehydrogenase